ncbi:hypothetical protein ACQKII_06965 [Lysinibacillus sp. NPDC048646]|uniref:hypothetical protein n=1 Tax=Lysinibacillus sp. NPDC048646 TaxID=3390574 RepID=UPI003D05C52C
MDKPIYLIDLGIKVKVTHLEFGGEKIPTPVGLSELLEPAWVIPTEEMLEKRKKFKQEIEEQYERSEYKNEKGRWVTCFIKKK